MTDENSNPGLQALGDALNLSFRAFRWVVFALLASYLASGIFVVKQYEKAFVLHFGRVAGLGQERIREPGLHWSLPRPFSEIVRVPAERIQTLSTATFWHGGDAEFQEEDANGASPTLNPESDGYLITGDANILHGRWSVRYTVSDPQAYVFNFADINRLLQNELDRTVTRVAGQMSIDRALRTGIEALREGVETELAARCRELGLGLKIQGVDVLALIPPRQVAQAFDRVVQAEQERSRQISEARAYATRTMNEAQGEAARRRVEGETAKRSQLAEISADADAFRQVYDQYQKNPMVFLETLKQDRVRRALSNVDQKFVVHSRDGSREIRLQLGPEQKRPGARAD